MPREILNLLTIFFCSVASFSAAATPIDPSPKVISGEVEFSGLSTNEVIITQESVRAIVDYDQFNVLSGDMVRFIQPSEHAAILNRITGNVPSLINGTITANGQVFFVNPAGVTFGENSVVRADLFLAAAGDISNEDFLNENLEFKLSGAIENLGLLESNSGTFLLGNQIINTGKVKSEQGVSLLASGEEIFLKNHGSNLMLRVSDDLSQPKENGIGINNLGEIDGEEVMFSAGDAFADAIYHQGIIRAEKSAKLHSNGGNIKVSGKIEASSNDGGGRIEIGGTDKGAGTVPRAANVSIFDTAVLDASARSGGDGGDVVIWSDGHTEMFGSIFAEGENGGFTEVSGSTYDFGVSAWRIHLGQGGRFLLDPKNITIGVPLAEEIVKQLKGGTDVTISTNNEVATAPVAIQGEINDADGDIIVDADIRVPANNEDKFAKLTLDSARDIKINPSDSADQIRIYNLQDNGSSDKNVFEFKAKNDITINGVIDNFGGGGGQILLDAGGNVAINSTIDANRGAVTILGDNISITNATTSILSGQSTSSDNLVKITAQGDLTFDGGRLQLFGDTDVVISAKRFINNTGSNVFSVNAASADSVQWSMALPKLMEEGRSIHAFGGLKSYNPTQFGSPGDATTPRNEYHFAFEPTITVTANDDSKIYGEISATPFEGISFDESNLIDASLYGGVFTQDTILTSVNQDGLELESVGSSTDANVRSHDISASGLESSNGYNFEYVTGTLTVSKRAITLTASDQEKFYGNELDLGDTAFTIEDLDGGEDLPNGEVIDTVSLVSANGVNASTTKDVGPYADNISITQILTDSNGFDQTNYNISYKTGNLTINRRAITVTASEQQKSYGEVRTLDGTLFSIEDLDNNEVLPNNEEIKSLNLNSVTNKDTSTFASANDETDENKSYSNEIEVIGINEAENGFDLDNYTITYEAGDLKIIPRAITLTADNRQKIYGDVLDLGDKAFIVRDLDGNEDLPNGELIDTVSLVSADGVDASTTKGVGSDEDNISITPPSLNNSTLTGSNGFNEANYDISYVSGNLTINRRAITLSASEQEKIYGNELNVGKTAFSTKDLDGNSELPNGEVIDTVSLVSENGVDASTDADVKTYADNISITPTTTDDSTLTGSNGFNQENYDISYVSGDLSINRRAITLSASDQEKIYGDVLSLDDTAFSTKDLDGNSELPNGELIDTVSLVSATGRDASMDADVGMYVDEIQILSPVTGTKGDGDGFRESNYDITYVSGNLTINRRAITLSASDQEKIYGDILDLGKTAFSTLDKDGNSDLPNGEVIDIVSLVSADGVDGSTNSDVKTYADNISITPTTTDDSTLTGSNGFDQENYDISYVSGDLSINRRAITLSASEQEKIYGDILDLGKTAFSTLDKDGNSDLPNGEVIDIVSLVSADGVDGSTNSDVKTYNDNISITPTVTGAPTLTGSNGFDQENYDISYVSGDLTINRRAITLSASDQEKIYGDVLDLGKTAFSTLDKDGNSKLPNDEVINEVTLRSYKGYSKSTSTNAGTYADNISITPTVTDDSTLTGSNGFNQENYDISYVSGDLTINRRAITLSASDQEKIYGDVLSLDDTAFSVEDLDGDEWLPNAESINSVTLLSRDDIDFSRSADVGVYRDNISIKPTAEGAETISGSGNMSAVFNQENYDISYVAGDLTINRRAITLTASEQEKIYGDVLSLDDTAFSTLDKDGDKVLPNGEVIDTVSLVSENGVDGSTNSDVKTYTDNISITPTVTGAPTLTGSNGFDQENYDISYVSGDLSINRRAITLSASEQEKIYGDILDLGKTAFSTLDKDGNSDLPNGEVIDIVSLVSADGVDGSTNSDVKTYNDNISITPTVTGAPTLTGSNGFDQENYDISYVSGDLTINRRAITLSASDQEKIYGDVLDLGKTAFSTLDKDGDKVLPNGEVIDTVSLVSENGVDGSTNSDVKTYTDNISITPTATDDSTLTGSNGFNQENYDISYVSGDLTINRRAITLSASDQEKIYGDILDLGKTAFSTLDKDGNSDLPNGEVIDIVSLVSADGVDGSTNSDVKTYTDNISITPTTTDDSTLTGSNGFNQENYDISYVSGDLSINRRAITLTASEQEKIYGDVLSLDDTAFSTLDKDGDEVLPNGEVIDTVSLVSENGVDASTDADVKTYADNISITPTTTDDSTLTGSNGFDQENYDISYVSGDLTINRRAITLSASDQEKIYGDVLSLNDTAFSTLDKDGDEVLPNGEVITNVSIVSAIGKDKSTDADVGTYVDEIEIFSPVTGTDGSGDGFRESNYDITYLSGDLTINRRAITLTASEQEKIYGDVLSLDDTAFSTLDKDGDKVLPNGEVIDTVSLVSENGVDGSTNSDVKTYTDNISITPTSTDDSTLTGSNGFDQENYDISYVSGDLSINRRAITLTASEQEKIYGDVLSLDDTAFSTLDKDGDEVLPNGEVIDTVSLVSENGVDASTDADVKTYADNISITPTTTDDSTLTGSNGFDQENYDISYVSGDLTINRRAITLTASEQEKIYGDVLSLDDTAFSTLDKDGDEVLPNGEVIDTVSLVSENGVDGSTNSDVKTYTDNISITPTSTDDSTLTGSNGFDQENYDISYVSGDLSINRRAITLTASEQEKIYGDVLSLDDTAFSTLDKDGDEVLPNGEVIDTVSLVSENGVDASTDADVKTYADNISITPTTTDDSTLTGSNGFDQENYDISYVSGDLTINRRAITLSASEQEKIYGDVLSLDDTAFSTLDKDGDEVLPNGEVIDTVSLVSENGVDASTDADVKTYADNISITPTTTDDSTLTGSNGFDQENYDISYVSGDLSINRRAITLTASEQEKIYGDVLSLDDTAFSTLDKDGDEVLPNGEVIDTVSLVSENGVDASTDADVKTYADNISITPTTTDDSTLTGSNGFDQENYDISYVSGDLTINRRDSVVIIDDQVRFAGQTFEVDQSAFVLTDPLPNNEGLSLINTYSVSGAATDPSIPKGFYPDEFAADSTLLGVNGFDANNYNFTFVSGSLEILPYPGLSAIFSEFDHLIWNSNHVGLLGFEQLDRPIPITDTILYRIFEICDWASIQDAERNSIIEKLEKTNNQERTEELLKYYLNNE